MNRSGLAAAALCSHYSAGPAQLLVVHDDADLELGRLRVRPEGRAGGHNGLRSLIEALGSQQFPRVKLGIRGASRGEGDLAAYVLDVFEPAERSVADALVERGVRAVEAILAHGVAEAMNRCNASSIAETTGPEP
jgi:PTH1 family peptidyl-tRNA hydrolase